MSSAHPLALRSLVFVAVLAVTTAWAPQAGASAPADRSGGSSQPASSGPADPSAPATSGGKTGTRRADQPADEPVDPPADPLVATITMSGTGSTYGTAGVLEVQVSGPDGAATPTGTVRLSRDSDGALTPAAALVDGKASLTVPATWEPGTVPVTVAYSGDDVFGPGQGSGAVQIEAADPTLSVSAAPQQFPAAGSVVVKVAGPGALAPTGQVTVTVGSVVTSAVLAGGTATVSTGNRKPGSYQMTVAYAGDVRYRSAQITGEFSVDRALATIATSVTQAGSYGGSARVAVRVTGTGGTPGGRVAVVNGSRRVTGTLAGGAATLSLPTDWVGSRTVVVEYAGDSLFASASRGLVVTSGRARTGLSVGSVATTYGAGPTFRVTVVGAGSRPSGIVSLMLDGRVIGNGAVRSGSATVTTTVRPSPGLRRVTLRYNGSTLHAASSAAANWRVSQASPTVRASGTPATATTRARVTVRVTGIGVGPGGRVEVRSGYRVLVRATLNRGAATLVLPVLGVGNHRLTVAYLGDSRFRAGTVGVVVPVTRARSFGDGLFRVGTDIPAGLYRVNAGASLCYWELRTDTSDSFSGIITNDIGYGYRLVEVRASDRFIRSSRCGTWRLVSETANWPFRGGRIPGDGVFLVGRDVAAGTYAQYGDDCYVASLSNGRSDFAGIIDNHYIGPGESITWRIDATDFAFESSGCGTWYKVG